MLYYDRSDVSESTDVNKTGESKERNICHLLCFIGKRFRFQPDDDYDDDYEWLWTWPILLF